jgi:hypothetical protein
MGDDHPWRQRAGSLHSPHDGLTAQSVETIAMYPAITIDTGQRIRLRLGGHRAVKSSIETRVMCRIRIMLHRRPYQHHRLRIVQGSKLIGFFQQLQHLRRDSLMSPQLRPWMYHAITNGINRQCRLPRHRLKNEADRLLQGLCLDSSLPVANAGTPGPGDLQRRRAAADACQLPLPSHNQGQICDRIVSAHKHGKLDGRRAAIKNQYAHFSASHSPHFTACFRPRRHYSL